MARKKRERQKVIRRRAPSDAPNAKTKSILPSKLSERSFAARDRSFHALWQIRQGASPRQAARDNGVTLRTMKKYVDGARARSSGRTDPCNEE